MTSALRPDTGSPRSLHHSRKSEIASPSFGLTPPSSLEEVRKARNREIKKYHSDHFVNDSERYETSKQIMQIYNAAYDRLKEHFEARKGNP